MLESCELKSNQHLYLATQLWWHDIHTGEPSTEFSRVCLSTSDPFIGKPTGSKGKTENQPSEGVPNFEFRADRTFVPFQNSCNT